MLTFRKNNIKTHPKRSTSDSVASATKYIAHFKNYTDEDSGTLADKKCFVPFCVGQPYHEDEKLNAITRLIVASGLNVIGLIDDHNDADGTWIKRHQSTIEKDFPISRIYNWGFLVQHKNFSEHEERVKRLYKTDNDFRKAADDYVTERTEKHDKNNTDAWAKNHEYLITECTLMEMLLTSKDKNDHFDCVAYPRKPHEVFILTFKRCAPKREIEWLEIKFKPLKIPRVQFFLLVPPSSIFILSNDTRDFLNLNGFSMNTDDLDKCTSKQFERYTPLTLATIQVNKKVCMSLIDNGASINAQNKLGNTALHMLAWFYHKNGTHSISDAIDLADNFLVNGGDLSIVNHSGQSPLDIVNNIEFNNRPIATKFYQYKSTLI